MDYEKNVGKIIKIQSFFRKIFIRSVIAESKREFLGIFNEIEEMTPNSYEMSRKWIKDFKLNRPKFGFSTKHTEKEEKKKQLIAKMMSLHEKIDHINKKILERKAELGMKD